jgi:hypothetical protein
MRLPAPCGNRNTLNLSLLMSYIYGRDFLLSILIFKGLTALRLFKSFGVKGLIR